MSYSILMTQEAQEDILKLRKSGDKVALKKLDILLNELREHPETGTGKPEKLRNRLSGKWSRHITDKHRLIYEIREEGVCVLILNTYGHYSDK
jgi:toxin YoeB